MTHLSAVRAVCKHLSEFLCNVVSHLVLLLEADFFAVKADHLVLFQIGVASTGSHGDDHVDCLLSYYFEACAPGRFCTVNETRRSY